MWVKNPDQKMHPAPGLPRASAAKVFKPRSMLPYPEVSQNSSFWSELRWRRVRKYCRRVRLSSCQNPPWS